MDSFWFAFIPLFVAMDPVGAIPLFLSLTNDFSSREKRRLALQAVTTALIIGITFGVAGRSIFNLLGITPSDFQIAGGLLLLIISVKEIFGITVKDIGAPLKDKLIGVVPLGIPLIAGPAMMTTLLILQDSRPYLIVMLALFVNLLITLVLFLYAEKIERRIGEGVSKVAAKVVSIFLAAIGIMMIRKGLETILLR